MNNYKIEVLPNGLTLVYIKTNKKNAKGAYIYVKIGGLNKEAYINDKKIKVIDGTAHFIEHLLIERSMYGNMLLEYSKNNIRTNGMTSLLRTEYFFETTKDFEENLVKLINMINKPVFKQKDIDEIKDAIIKEKLEREDDKYYEYHTSVYECLFKELKAPNTLGNIEDIKNMKYDYIKQIYDIFYNPSNQILVINGNLKYQKIKKLIIDTYGKTNKENYIIPKFNLTDQIQVKEKTIKKDIPNNHTRIVYKVNLSNYTPLERLKFDWYFGIYIKYFLNEIDEEIVKEKTSSNSIGFYNEYIEDYTLLWFSLQTKQCDKYLNLLKNYFKKIKVPKEDFELAKKMNLIYIIQREESSYGQVSPLVDNILMFNYFGIDSPEFIESLNYEEFTNFINNIDFSNYTVIKLIKENN